VSERELCKFILEVCLECSAYAHAMQITMNMRSEQLWDISPLAMHALLSGMT